MIIKNKMKICFFGDIAASHLCRWANYFAKKGHKVYIITFNPNGLNCYHKEIRIHVIKKYFSETALIFRILSVIPMMFAIKKLIKKIGPDIIHSHSAGGYAWTVMLSRFHPFIITPWGSDILIDIKKSKIEKFFTKLALRKSDLITCDGENIKDAMIDINIPAQKIKFITFGVDTLKFKPLLSNNNNFKRKIGLLNSKIVISTRFLTSVHDVETLIKAIPAVLSKISNAKFVIVGNGPQQEYLMNLAKKLNVFSATKFIGQVSEEEMICYLQIADIFVSTSLSESGLSASTAEAMACGLPIINTNTGDIGLWIKDGKSGFIISAKNPKILAEKIIYLFNNNKERLKFSEINSRVIEERNNYYKEMEKMEDIYKKISKNNFGN